MWIGPEEGRRGKLSVEEKSCRDEVGQKKGLIVVVGGVTEGEGRSQGFIGLSESARSTKWLANIPECSSLPEIVSNQGSTGT